MNISSNRLSVTLSKSTKIVIEPTEDRKGNAFNIEAPIYAINWFNLKSGVFYNLYTLLARRYVQKVSGKLFFKGKLIKHIEGKEKYLRENLMIVFYSSPEQFLKLLSYKAFQLIGLLRLLSVKRFCLGFTENIDSLSMPQSKSFTKEKIYLVYPPNNALFYDDNALFFLFFLFQVSVSITYFTLF